MEFCKLLRGGPKSFSRTRTDPNIVIKHSFLLLLCISIRLAQTQCAQGCLEINNHRLIFISDNLSQFSRFTQRGIFGPPLPPPQSPSHHVLSVLGGLTVYIFFLRLHKPYWINPISRNKYLLWNLSVFFYFFKRTGLIFGPSAPQAPATYPKRTYNILAQVLLWYTQLNIVAHTI